MQINAVWAGSKNKDVFYWLPIIAILKKFTKLKTKQDVYPQMKRDLHRLFKNKNFWTL